MRIIVAVPLLCFGCASSPAVDPDEAGPACKPVENVYLEYQVNRPAVYLESNTKSAHPVSSSASSVARGTGLVIEFVVDTLGKPNPRSFKILRTPDEAAATAARDALLGWRFIPATVQGCKVPQLVQTEITH